MEKTAPFTAMPTTGLSVRFSPVCCSAQVMEAYDEYRDQFGAGIDIKAFAQLYSMKLYDNRAATTLELDAAIKADQRDQQNRAGSGKDRRLVEH